MHYFEQIRPGAFFDATGVFVRKPEASRTRAGRFHSNYPLSFKLFVTSFQNFPLSFKLLSIMTIMAAPYFQLFFQTHFKR